MKSIYLLLTKSDTYVSKTIGLATSDKYTHISISFEETLEPLYSFARKYKRTPLPAGIRPVSYTHLDVYKRQIYGRSI